MESQQYASMNHSIPSRDDMSSQYSSLQRIPTSSRKTKNQHVQSQKFECIICQKSTSSCCSGCKQVFYCGPQHQILHWETHQYECIPAQEQEEEEENSFLSNQSTRQPASRKEEKIYPTPKEAKQIRYLDDVEDDLGNQRVHQSLQSNHQSGRPAREYSPPPQSSGRKSTKNFESPESSERKIMIQEALRSYSDSDCTQAIEKATNAYKLSQLICRQQNAQNSNNLVSDGLLLAKILIDNDSTAEAKEILLEVWEVIQDIVKFTQLDAKDKQSIEILENITLMLSTIAGLFKSIGDFTNSEAAYLIYIKIMEAYFGNHSLEVSNCFFLVGVFYLEEKQYLKAMACFKKALRIREARYKDPEGHETIADCHYNIALIYKQTHKSAKALESLGNALRIRQKQVGENSLPAAQVLEIMAKIHFGMEDYQQTFDELQSCFLIRQKLVNNPDHPDLKRIKKFAKILHQKVEDLLKESQLSNDFRTQIKYIQNQILHSPIYSN